MSEQQLSGFSCIRVKNTYFEFPGADGKIIKLPRIGGGWMPRSDDKITVTTEKVIENNSYGYVDNQYIIHDKKGNVVCSYTTNKNRDLVYWEPGMNENGVTLPRKELAKMELTDNGVWKIDEMNPTTAEIEQNLTLKETAKTLGFGLLGVGISAVSGCGEVMVFCTGGALFNLARRIRDLAVNKSEHGNDKGYHRVDGIKFDNKLIIQKGKCNG